LGSDGVVKERYDKMFLVPFGEYVPLHSVFGFLEPVAYTMGVSDFTPGDNYEIFRTELQVPFGTMICFENVFPNVARKFVEHGASFLMVATNDAWFSKSAAPYQHLQKSIFRAVENGVSIVHCANTGVSAFVSHTGEVSHRVRDNTGEDIFVTGQQTAHIDVVSRPTFYKLFGHRLPYGGMILFMMFYLGRRFFRGSHDA